MPSPVSRQTLLELKIEMELGKKKKSIIQNARVDGHKGKTFLLAGGNETDTFLRTITNDLGRAD